MKNFFRLFVIFSILLVGCGGNSSSEKTKKKSQIETKKSDQAISQITPKEAKKRIDNYGSGGSDPYDYDKYYYHEAIKNGALKVVELFKQAGMDLTAKSRGLSPLHTLARHSYDLDSYDRKARIRPSKAKFKNKLNNYKQIFDILINANINVNSNLPHQPSKGYYGETPLMIAAEKGNVWLTNKLIRAGANVNAKDGRGRTALMHAANLGRNEVLKILIDAGSEINVKDGNGNTALSLANSGRVDEDDEKAIEILKKRGAKE